MRYLAFFLTACACTTGFAAEQIVKQVKIVVKSAGRDVPTEGRLYKILDQKAKREFVANVDSEGKVDAPFMCSSPMRVWAEPVRDDVATLEDAKPCNGNLVFRFEVPRMVLASEVFARGTELAAQGQPGAAQFAYSQAAWEAKRRGDQQAATIASNAAISAAAAALGDVERSELVTRDPVQANRMVFTKDGKSKLQQFQRESQIKETGQLDYATQKALSYQKNGVKIGF